MAQTDPKNPTSPDGGVNPGEVPAMRRSNFNGNRIGAPVTNVNPGQQPGSGMAGAGNVVPACAAKNEGCIDPGERRFQ